MYPILPTNKTLLLDAFDRAFRLSNMIIKLQSQSKEFPEKYLKIFKMSYEIESDILEMLAEIENKKECKYEVVECGPFGQVKRIPRSKKKNNKS